MNWDELRTRLQAVFRDVDPWPFKSTESLIEAVMEQAESCYSHPEAPA